MLPNKTKWNKRGSVLVFTLFIMMLSLIVGMSVINVTSIDRKSSFATTRSVFAFQVADYGLEWMLQRIKFNTDPSGIINNITFFGSCNADNEKEVNTFGGSGGVAVVTFYDSDDNQLTCNDQVSDIKTIKSVGKYRETSRAVRMTFP